MGLVVSFCKLFAVAESEQEFKLAKKVSELFRCQSCRHRDARNRNSSRSAFETDLAEVRTKIKKWAMPDLRRSSINTAATTRSNCVKMRNDYFASKTDATSNSTRVVFLRSTFRSKFVSRQKKIDCEIIRECVRFAKTRVNLFFDAIVKYFAILYFYISRKKSLQKINYFVLIVGKGPSKIVLLS